ncbi:hypothetical protein [Bradyrhizobium zhanjiangense]|uniref:hypothetical protein n=1 Tax=Bradyrhizobium zhanjiangense TaxID=1325107 RepID=UPI001008C236|nr:hypothetical protein [Bradyrhizobium zhanjiangense]
MAFLISQREQLRPQAAAFVLRFYRTHGRLPAGYITALLPRSALRRIRLRGEIEHALGLARILIKLDGYFE